MKKLLLVLFVLLLLGGGGFAAWWFYFKPAPVEEATTDTPTDVEADPNGSDTKDGSTDAAAASNTGGNHSTTSGQAKPGDLARLAISNFSEWSGRYDRFLHSWTYEHKPKTDNGPKEGLSRFYIGRMPDDAPRDMHAYAKELRTNVEFQDMGYLYAEIDDTEVYGDGWLIQGKVQDTARPDEPSILSFVHYRVIDGVHIRCRGSSFHNEKVRQSAIDGCRRAAFN